MRTARHRDTATQQLDSFLCFFSGEVDHPVFRPGLTVIQRAMTLPVGAAAGNVGPGEPGENPLPAVIVPLAEINVLSPEPATPHEKTARGRSVSPCVLPAPRLGVESAKTEAFDDFSLVRPFKELHGGAAIENLRGLQRPRPLSPTAVGSRETANGIPFPFEKIELPCLRYLALAQSAFRVSIRHRLCPPRFWNSLRSEDSASVGPSVG